LTEIPDKLDLHTAQIWAEQLGVPVGDWPEEKWTELSAGNNAITRDQFMKVVEELTLQPLSSSPAKSETHDGDEEIFAIDGGGGGDEEVFAADGDFEHSQDDNLGKGTFTEEEEDGEEGGDDLGGMILPGLELVANGASGNHGTMEGDRLTELGAEGEEEIFAADGEAFDGSQGPGVFNETDLGITDASGSPVRGGGEAGNPACGDGTSLTVVGSPVANSPNSKDLGAGDLGLSITGLGTK
jgi:hypothetical protein